jgi:hypothetical protein
MLVRTAMDKATEQERPRERGGKIVTCEMT